MCHSEAETVLAICLQNRVPRVQVLLPLTAASRRRQTAHRLGARFCIVETAIDSSVSSFMGILMEEERLQDQLTFREYEGHFKGSK